MSLYVVDASVVVKWLIPEEHSAEAVRLLEEHELIAPDLVLPEVGNIFWKMQRRGEMDPEEALSALETLTPPPFVMHPSEKLLPSAYLLAAHHDRTVYDSLYLALAVASETRMVTADRKLVNALTRTELSDHLLWIGDLPSATPDP
jgi:predicted nucleic acid-binding protein